MPRKSRQAGFSLLELIVVAAMGMVIAGFAIPTYQRAMRNYRLMGDIRTINGEIQLTKMRAASNFTRTRIYFDPASRRFVSQVWCRAIGTPRVCTTGSGWQNVSVGGPLRLSQDIRFGVASQTSAPSGTQSTLTQPLTCRTGTPGPPQDPGGGSDIANTYCIVFNSRGFPVNNAGASYGDFAIYINDGSSVQGVTVSATGQSAIWRHDGDDVVQAHWYRH